MLLPPDRNRPNNGASDRRDSSGTRPTQEAWVGRFLGAMGIDTTRTSPVALGMAAILIKLVLAVAAIRLGAALAHGLHPG